MIKDPYFKLLDLYRKEESITWDRLVRLSKDVEYVGVFDEHGISLVSANEYLKEHEFIKQTPGEPQHFITDKGKNYHGVEFLERKALLEKESLTIQKLKGDVDKLTKELADYATTKLQARISLGVSLISLLFAAITLMVKCSNHS